MGALLRKLEIVQAMNYLGATPPIFLYLKYEYFLFFKTT